MTRAQIHKRNAPQQNHGNSNEILQQLQKIFGQNSGQGATNNSLPSPMPKTMLGHNNPPEDYNSDLPETISNLSVSYESREDRLMLRAGTTQYREFRYWITYRLYRLLLGLFNQIEDAGLDPNIPEVSKQAVREFQRERNLQGTNFNEEIAKDRPYLPIFGENPLLIDKIEAKVSKKIIQFVFTSDKQVTSLPLPRETAIALRHMMNQAASRAEWDNQPIYQKSSKDEPDNTKPTPVILN